MWKIEIGKGLREIAYTDKRTGERRTLRVQTGYFFSRDADGTIAQYPDKFEIVLGRTQDPYPPGVYGLGLDSLYVADGKLRISPRLSAMPQPTPSAKAAA